MQAEIVTGKNERRHTLMAKLLSAKKLEKQQGLAQLANNVYF